MCTNATVIGTRWSPPRKGDTFFIWNLRTPRCSSRLHRKKGKTNGFHSKKMKVFLHFFHLIEFSRDLNHKSIFWRSRGFKKGALLFIRPPEARDSVVDDRCPSCEGKSVRARVERKKEVFWKLKKKKSVKMKFETKIIAFIGWVYDVV